jgi:hypothetical protein
VRVIEGLGEFLQGLLARGPAQQAKRAELPDRVIEIRVRAFDRRVRRADLDTTAGISGPSSTPAPLRPALRQWPTISRALACRQPVAGQSGVK